MTTNTTSSEPRRAPDRIVTMFDYVGRLDRGAKAELRRTLRNDAQIDPSVWWLLGRFLSKDLEVALVEARVAALFAEHGSTPAGTEWRNLGGELRRSGVNEEAARRALAVLTSHGTSSVVRIQTLANIMPQIAKPSTYIDWPLLAADMSRLNGDSDICERVRSRWYRQYHQYYRNSETSAEAENESTTEKE